MLTDNILISNSYPKNFKHEECPVCNNLDARCRPSHEDSILCWNTSASELDEDVWFLIADIDARGSGMRGVMVAPRRNSEQEVEDPEFLELRRLQAKQKRSLELAHLPSLESRAKGYKEILESLKLSGHHKFDLKNKRGLTAEQINFAEKLQWFKTWEKGIECSENIAGIDPATNSTRWLGGMFIASVDQQGRILGGQIAADNIEVVGKYFWLSSAKVGGYGCQLPFTGKFPLFVRKHPDSKKTSQIWLCEGGLKSALIALKAWEFDINIVVIGTAMSARFTDQLSEIIGEFQPSDGVCILPDAGTLQNISILSGVLETVEQIRKYGFEATIAWWGQLEKNENSQDFDDYLMANNGDLSKVCWYNVSQFLGLLTPTALIEYPKKNDGEFTPPLPFEPIPTTSQTKKIEAKVKDFLNSYGYKGYKKYCTFDAPDTSKQGNIITHQPKLATNLNDDGATPFEAGWEFYPPRVGEILFLQAGTGEGKSHLLSKWMNEYYPDSGCIFLGYRNGLLHQQCEKVDGLQHLRGADVELLDPQYRKVRLLDPNYRVAFCDASLHNMKPSYASGKILVFDEVMSILESLLLGSTCSRQRRTRLNIFTEMLQEASMVICLDAHLANWAVTLLQILSKNKTVRKMQNKWEGQPRKVKMLLGTETNPNDKTAIRANILSQAKEGTPIAVFSDSQHELESLNELMIAVGVDPKSITRIDSKTSGEPWAVECLSNIDKYLENHPEIKVLLVSPSGDSGLDISRVYFEHVYLILVGTLTINSALQMYGRVRDRAVKRTVFCAKDAQYRVDGGFTKAQVQKDMMLSIEHQIRLITDGVEDSENLKDVLFAAVQKWQQKEKDDLFAEAVTILLAKANFEKLYYRDLFIERLEQMGDLIEFVNEKGDEETNSEFQEVSLELKYTHAKRLVAAEDISKIEAESYRRKELNQEQLMQLKKFDFKNRIPGVDIDESLAKTLLYDRAYLTGLEQRYYLSHPEVSIKMARMKWGGVLTYSEYFTADLRTRLALRTDCLIKLGLSEFLDDRDWLEAGREITKVRKRWEDLIKIYGAEVPAILGFDWDYERPILTIHKLLNLVGCDLRVVKAKIKQPKNTPKIRRITYGSLNDPTRLAILASFDLRFAELKTFTADDWLNIKTVCENVTQEEVATAET